MRASEMYAIKGTDVSRAMVNLTAFASRIRRVRLAMPLEVSKFSHSPFIWLTNISLQKTPASATLTAVILGKLMSNVFLVTVHQQYQRAKYLLAFRILFTALTSRLRAMVFVVALPGKRLHLNLAKRLAV